jgi:hypothetical protein
MSGVAVANPKVQFFDAQGVPLAGGFVHVYLAGTTTPTDSWEDRALTTANENPIELDASGYATIWLSPDLTYKLTVKDAEGVTQYTVDNVVGAAGASILSTVTAAKDAALVEIEDAKDDAIAEMATVVSDAETALAATIVAKDSALAATKIYASTTAGLAGVASGEYFYVPSTDADESLVLYLDNAGSAVEQKRYPSAALVDDVADALALAATIGQPSMPLTLSASAGSGTTYINATAVAAGTRKLDSVRVQVLNGVDMTVAVWRVSAGNVVRIAMNGPHTLSTGDNTVNVDMAVEEGDYVGAMFAGNGLGQGSGATPGTQTPYWLKSWAFAAPSFPQADATSNIRIALQFNLTTLNLITDLDTRMDDVEVAVRGRWYGANVFHFGDSLTEGATYGTYVTELASILGCNSTNYGSSGSATDRLFGHMTEWPARGGLPVSDVDPDYTNCDAVTIMIGSNGGTTGTTADIITESVYDLPYNVGGTDYTTAEEHFHRFGNTIYGNVAACVEYVRWKNPRTMIFLCTPPWYSADTGSRDFSAIFQYIADLYGIRMLDVRKEAGLYRKDINQFTYDGQHLNELGVELVAKYIAYRMLHA